MAKNHYKRERGAVRILGFGCGGAGAIHGIWRGKALMSMYLMDQRAQSVKRKTFGRRGAVGRFTGVRCIGVGL